MERFEKREYVVDGKVVVEYLCVFVVIDVIVGYILDESKGRFFEFFCLVSNCFLCFWFNWFKIWVRVVVIGNVCVFWIVGMVLFFLICVCFFVVLKFDVVSGR